MRDESPSSDPVSSVQTAKVAAEANKLAAEARRLDAETAALSRSTLATISEWTKIVGGIILGLGGVFAAITQYQLSEVKKENAALAVKLAEQDKERVVQQTTEIRKALTEHREQVLRSLAETQEEPYSPVDIEKPEHRWIKVLQRLETTTGDQAIHRIARIEIVPKSEEYRRWLVAKTLRIASTYQEAQGAARLIKERTAANARSEFEQLFLDTVVEASDGQPWTLTVDAMAHGAAAATAPALVLQVRAVVGGWPQSVRYVRYEFYASKNDEANGRALASYVATNDAHDFQLFLWKRPSQNAYVKYTAAAETGHVIAAGYAQLP